MHWYTFNAGITLKGQDSDPSCWNDRSRSTHGFPLFAMLASIMLMPFPECAENENENCKNAEKARPCAQFSEYHGRMHNTSGKVLSPGINFGDV